MTIKFLNMVTGKEYEETLEKVKFSGITWTHDNKVWYPKKLETFKWVNFRVFSMGAILATTQSTPLAKTQQVMVTKSCTTTGLEFWYLHLGCGQLVKFVA